MRRVACFAIIGCVGVLATASDPTQPAPATASQELRRLYDEDQSDSRPYGTPEERRQSDERARRRIEQVAAIVRQGALQSADDYYHAAMVHQHGNQPDDYLMAHVLATVAGFKGHSWGSWLSAAALDALLLSLGRPQILGTIYGKDFARYEPTLPDTLRREYCVPPLAIQRANQEVIEKRVGQFQRRAKECPDP